MKVMNKNVIPSLAVAVIIAAASYPVMGQFAPTAEPAPGQQATPDQQAVLQQLQEKQQQLEQVRARLGQLQQAAAEIEHVQEAHETYQEKLQEKMADIDADAPVLIERRDSLAERLTPPEGNEALSPEELENRQQHYAEFQEIHQRVVAVENRALQDEVVREAQSEFFATLVDEMRKLDENTEQLFEMNRQLLHEIREIQQSLRRG